MARYRVKREKLDEVRKAIVEFVEALKNNEDGTFSYEVLRESDAVSFVHFMTIGDERAKKIHENTAHVRKFVDLLYPNCEEQPVFSQMTLIRSNRR